MLSLKLVNPDSCGICTLYKQVGGVFYIKIIRKLYPVVEQTQVQDQDQIVWLFPIPDYGLASEVTTAPVATLLPKTAFTVLFTRAY